MARTAPTVNGTPTLKKVSLRWLDASGDPRADSMDVPAAATNAQVEALAAAISPADVTNAVLYAVEVTDAYNAVADKDDAVDAAKDSVYDNIVFLAKTATNLSKRLFVPAPAAVLFVPGSDTIDGTNADLTTLLTAYLALVAGGFEIVSGRYTERREINEAIKF